MAGQILNKMTGLIPRTEPKVCRGWEVATSQEIYPNMPVSISSGNITPLADPCAAVGDCVGVALGRGSAGDTVTVCHDDDMVYSILTSTGTEAQWKAVVGNFLAPTDHNDANTVGNSSNATAALADISATQTAAAFLQIMGVEPVVTGGTLVAGEVRLLVRIPVSDLGQLAQ